MPHSEHDQFLKLLSQWNGGEVNVESLRSSHQKLIIQVRLPDNDSFLEIVVGPTLLISGPLEWCDSDLAFAVGSDKNVIIYDYKNGFTVIGRGMSMFLR